MAVFTELSPQDVGTILTEYDLGDFISLTPIASGIENTNYFLDTTTGHWVLTVFERLTAQTLPYFLSLPEHLARKGCRVACPVRTKTHTLFTFVKNKPCTIANRLQGESCRDMNENLCRDMGTLLASMHLAVKDYPVRQRNFRDLAWMQETLPRLKLNIPTHLYEQVAAEIQYQTGVCAGEAYRSLGSYACHCDLFRDNTLILHHERVSGVFDFYFAGDMPWLYDLAVTMNDWCIESDTGRFKEKEAQAFIEAYHAVRALSEVEKTLWRDVLRLAALRFWVSRLDDFYRPREAALLKPHDPAHFERVLALRQNGDLPWPKNNR